MLRPKGVVAQPSPVQPGYRFYLFSCTVLIDCWIQVCDVTDTQGRAGGRASGRSVVMVTHGVLCVTALLRGITNDAGAIIASIPYSGSQKLKLETALLCDIRKSLILK